MAMSIVSKPIGNAVKPKRSIKKTMNGGEHGYRFSTFRNQTPISYKRSLTEPVGAEFSC